MNGGNEMRIRRSTVVATALTLLLSSAEPAWAQHPVPPASGIWESASPSYAMGGPARRRLLASLTRITGIDRLAFAPDGRLEVGDVGRRHAGSSIAARILRDAIASGDVFVLEDHSNDDTVNFGQIEEMEYFNDLTHRHARVWWIRLDFEDFHRMSAPPRVRTAFDEGFTMLHELLHAIGHRDATRVGELGECETILNQAREEVGLPVRAEYFATRIRDLGDATIRLRFLDGPIGHRNQIAQDLFFALSLVAPSAHGTSRVVPRGAKQVTAGLRLP